MSRSTSFMALVVVCAALVAAGCGQRDRQAIAAAGEPAPTTVATAPVVQQLVTRFIRVSGTLAAQEEAEVAAEVLGAAPAVNMRVGGSDSRWYRQHGVPTVVLGLTPFNMGAADEHVLVDELLAVAAIHTLVAYDYLSTEQ